MDKLKNIFTRGIRFAKGNPQIIYTLFLIIAIPLGFLFSSEQFLRVARENQDDLERSRIGLLQDMFVLSTADKLSDVGLLSGYIRSIAEKNPSMTTLHVLQKNTEDKYVVRASLNQELVGQVYPPDQLTVFLLNSSTGNIEESFAAEYFNNSIRYWRSTRAIPDPISGHILGYVITDMSMQQFDAAQKDSIWGAYLMLILIIILIILLLARQARIIDYATLYQRLKEVDTMKDNFVSMAAHELRSPLMIIRGYADELKSIENIDAKGMGFIGNIEIAANQLNTLVADILDVAKLQDGCLSFHYENVDVSEQLKTITETFQKPAMDKGLTLACHAEPLPPISVDVDRFRQIIINFVGNAIKYTPMGSVNVIAVAKDGNVHVRISDTGMGISAENQKKLFQKFFRIKNEQTSGITGTGLGLWITNEIVRSMHGTIAVESIEGKGTDFIVSFPIAKK